MSGDTIGMMEGAFFVSKGVILEWMNELLDVSAYPILSSFIYLSNVELYLTYFVLINTVVINQNRAVRDCCRLLPNHGCYLSRYL